MTAFALGLRRYKDQQTLDVLYPQIAFEAEPAILIKLTQQLGLEPQQNQWVKLTPAQLNLVTECCQGSSQAELAQLLLAQPPQPQAYGALEVGLYLLADGQSAVATPEEAYFKLQLLSQRHVLPHQVNLNGIFGVLNNLAWSNLGPILPADLEQERLKALLNGQPLTISHVDKFPYLVNYHLPSGVRIASGSQVRLGAYLGEGTTVMPAGYVNYNAGTLGHAMIEGRVSAGVIVGDKSDVGGGASIMGTLSGGNTHVISVGEQCLLGANSGTGISLGKGCTIAAGLYVYAGVKVALLNSENQPVDLRGQVVPAGQNIVKASELSGRDYLLFIQDSTSGQVICKPNRKMIALNQELHQHN